MKTKLIPPDKDRCQCEVLGGSFMTLGPRQWERCPDKAVYIAKEKQAGDDGQRGSMSLCEKCANRMLSEFGPKFATLEKIKRKRAT